MEEKKGIIKKMLSFFKKKVDDKKVDNKKIETDVKIVKNERRVVNLAERTTDKVATVRTAGKKEVEMKKCPYCGSDLSSGKNVRTRSKQNKDRVSADEEDYSDFEKIYQSSIFIIGNFLFPDSLTLFCDGMSFREGSMFGSTGKHFNYREVVSVRIEKGILFSEVLIETGRHRPVELDGLWENEAKEIKRTIYFFKKKAELDYESSRRNGDFDDEYGLPI